VRCNRRELKNAVDEVDGRDPSFQTVRKVDSSEPGGGSEAKEGDLGRGVLASAGESQGEANGRGDGTDCLSKPEVMLPSRDGLEAAAMD
jgi:hypothetical protein